MAEKMATRQAYGETLLELGKKYENLVVMDADLSKSTMTAKFGAEFPDRFFNMGIAEQNLYGTAAGLALSGKIVCASTFAMFASGRAFEIIRNSIIMSCACSRLLRLASNIRMTHMRWKIIEKYKKDRWKF